MSWRMSKEIWMFCVGDLEVYRIQREIVRWVLAFLFCDFFFSELHCKVADGVQQHVPAL